MIVIVNVVNAVAEIAGAFRAIAEFQIRAICVRATTDGAFVAVRMLAFAVAVVLCPVRIGLFLRVYRSLGFPVLSFQTIGQ